MLSYTYCLGSPSPPRCLPVYMNMSPPILSTPPRVETGTDPLSLYTMRRVARAHRMWTVAR